MAYAPYIGRVRYFSLPINPFCFLAIQLDNFFSHWPIKESVIRCQSPSTNTVVILPYVQSLKLVPLHRFSSYQRCFTISFDPTVPFLYEEESPALRSTPGGEYRPYFGFPVCAVNLSEMHIF